MKCGKIVHRVANSYYNIVHRPRAYCSQRYDVGNIIMPSEKCKQDVYKSNIVYTCRSILFDIRNVLGHSDFSCSFGILSENSP